MGKIKVYSWGTFSVTFLLLYVAFTLVTCCWWCCTLFAAMRKWILTLRAQSCSGSRRDDTQIESLCVREWKCVTWWRCKWKWKENDNQQRKGHTKNVWAVNVTPAAQGLLKLTLQLSLTQICGSSWCWCCCLSLFHLMRCPAQTLTDSKEDFWRKSLSFSLTDKRDFHLTVDSLFPFFLSKKTLLVS